jgi:hypothetical protein
MIYFHVLYIKNISPLKKEMPTTRSGVYNGRHLEHTTEDALLGGPTATTSKLNSNFYTALQVNSNNRVGCTTAGVMLEGPTIQANADTSVSLDAPTINTYSGTNTTMTSSGALTIRRSSTDERLKIEAAKTTLTGPTIDINGTSTTEITSAAHIKLIIGSDTAVHCTSSSVRCEPILESTILRLSGNGGMLVDNLGHARWAAGSYHHSGSYASEIRKMPIKSNFMVADNDSSSGAMGATIADAASNDPYGAGTVGSRYVMGVGMSNSASEGYIFLPSPPASWKTYAIYVSVYNKDTATAQTTALAVVSRTYSHSGTYTSDHLTRHLTMTSTAGGSNQLLAFTAPFIPSGGTQLVCALALTGTSHIMTGGYTLIARV